MPAVAVTDHGNLFGAMGFYEAATKAGVKPIIGCEMYVSKTTRMDRDPASGQAEPSDRSLRKRDAATRTSSSWYRKATSKGFYYKPRIDKDLLARTQRRSDRPVGLSEWGSLRERARWTVRSGGSALPAEYQDIFGKDRFFLEIHDHGLEKQRKIIPDMLKISERTGIRTTASNDCHYMEQDDCRAHDVLLCIQTGKTVNDPNRMKFYTDQFYFKTRQEMDESSAKFRMSWIRPSRLPNAAA